MTSFREATPVPAQSLDVAESRSDLVGLALRRGALAGVAFFLVGLAVGGEAAELYYTVVQPVLLAVIGLGVAAKLRSNVPLAPWIQLVLVASAAAATASCVSFWANGLVLGYGFALPVGMLLQSAALGAAGGGVVVFWRSVRTPECYERRSDPRPAEHAPEASPAPRSPRVHRLIVSGIVVVLAVGIASLHYLATSTDRLFSALESASRWDRSSVVADIHAAEMAAEPGALLPRVLGLASPALRGACHRTLASTGDPAKSEDILAYIASDKEFGSGFAARCRDAEPSLARLGETVLIDGLFRLFREQEDAALKSHVEERLTALPRESVQPCVLRIEEPAVRGRLHRILADSGDPEQIRAVLAYVESMDEMEVQRRRAGRWLEISDSLGRFGKGGSAVLAACLHSESRDVVNLCAETLRRSDLPFLVEHTGKQLEAYDGGIRELQKAFGVRELLRRQTDGTATAKELRKRLTKEQVETARATEKRFSQHAFLILEMLRALSLVPDDDKVDFCFIRGLSTFDESVATYCARTLKKRLTTDRLIDSLFRYIARKNRFFKRERQVYVAMMRDTGAAGAARIATNLDRLLLEARGAEKVFWYFKVIGFDALRHVGTKDQVPTLRRFLADTGGYVESGTRNGRTFRQDVSFRYECKTTIQAIEKRGK